MSSLIQELLRDSKVVFWNDYRSRSFYDFSGNGHTGTVNNLKLTNNHLEYTGASSNILINYNDNLRLTTGGSIIVLPYYTGLIGSSFFVSVTTAATSQYDFYWIAGDGKLRVRNGAVIAISTNSVKNNDEFPYNQCYGVTITPGITPSMFVNGVEIPVGVNPFTDPLQQNADRMRVGSARTVGSNCGTLGSLFITNEKLTAAQQAKIYQEISDLSWPSKVFSHKKVSILPPKLDSSMWAGYRTKKLDEVVVDESTNSYDLTADAGPTDIKTVLGNAVKFDGVGQLQTVAPNDTFTASTIEFWWRPRVGVANTSRIIEVGQNDIEVTTNNLGAGITVVVNGSDAYTQNDGITPDVWHHIVITYANGSGGNMYINGSLTATPAISDEGNLTAFTDLTIGSDYSLTLPVSGDVLSPCFYDEVKDATWVASKYILGAKSAPFKTDWGITESIANVTSGPITNSNIIASTGSWAVDVVEIDGELTKVLTCAAAGIAYIAQGHFHDTESGSAYGTFKWKALRANTSVHNVYFIADDTALAGIDAYLVRTANDGSVLTLVATAGAETTLSESAAALTRAETWNDYRVTRNYLGSFSTYVNGTLMSVVGGSGANPVANTAHTSSKYIVLEFDAGDKIALGNLQGDNSIVKYLGVVAP